MTELSTEGCSEQAAVGPQGLRGHVNGVEVLALRVSDTGSE